MMTDALTQEQADAVKRLEQRNAAVHEAQIDHAFSWWWWNTGASAPPRPGQDLEKHMEEVARMAFHEACRLFALKNPKPAVQEPPKLPINLCYSLFSLGVGVGIFLTFALGLIIIQPK